MKINTKKSLKWMALGIGSVAIIATPVAIVTTSTHTNQSVAQTKTVSQTAQLNVVNQNIDHATLVKNLNNFASFVALPTSTTTQNPINTIKNWISQAHTLLSNVLTYLTKIQSDINSSVALSWMSSSIKPILNNAITVISEINNALNDLQNNKLGSVVGEVTGTILGIEQYKNEILNYLQELITLMNAVPQYTTDSVSWVNTLSSFAEDTLAKLSNIAQDVANSNGLLNSYDNKLSNTLDTWANTLQANTKNENKTVAVIESFVATNLTKLASDVQDLHGFISDVTSTANKVSYYLTKAESDVHVFNTWYDNTATKTIDHVASVIKTDATDVVNVINKVSSLIDSTLNDWF